MRKGNDAAPVEVAAAVLLRADGAFLLARRPPGKAYAGYWEFPGGKVEPGEALSSALARELHEELGIVVSRSYPWITATYAYPHATVRLNFRRVTAWTGEPQPQEGQVIAWQLPDAPMAAPMLPANAPVLASLALPCEYAITEAGRRGTGAMLERLAQRLEQGLRLVQVREPGLSRKERDAFTATVIGMARPYGCRVLVKDPFPGADGLHLTAAELGLLEVRPAHSLVAASCHTRAELERAMRLGLDFAVLGPVRPTASHEGAPVLGWERFTALAAGASIPVYAIGGMRRSDREQAWVGGAHGVAMITGAWQ